MLLVPGPTRFFSTESLVRLVGMWPTSSRMGDVPGTEEAAVCRGQCPNVTVGREPPSRGPYPTRASGREVVRLPPYQRSPCTPFRHRLHCEGAQPYKLRLVQQQVTVMPGSTQESGIAFTRTRASRAWPLSLPHPLPLQGSASPYPCAALGADGGSAGVPRGQQSPSVP